MATNLPALSEAFDSVITYEPEKSIRSHMRIALIAAFILVFGLFLMAAVIPIGGAVIGGGQLGVESQVKKVDHPTGGIIAEIKVKDGDHVKRGQVLIRLDTTVTGVSADLSGQTADQLLAQRARLESERDGRASVLFPPVLAKRGDTQARLAMQSQLRLFGMKRSEQAGMQSQMRQRVAQLEQQISGYQAQISSLRQQQVLLKPERDGVKELWEKDLVTINRLNQLERSSVDMEGSIAALQATIAQTQAKIAETREQSIQLGQSTRSDAATELAQVITAYNEQQVNSTHATDVFERSLIRAPYDGIVDKLAYSTVGGVIAPAEPIMEIVPDADQLVVEAAISPADIDRVNIDQAARVKLTMFSAQSTPDLPGKVIFVSPERTTNKENGQSFYRIKVSIDKDAVKKEKLILKPGMPVEIFIVSGSRTMLSYITKPLRDQFARAFKE